MPDIVPVFDKVAVQRGMLHVDIDQGITVTINIKDVTTSPGQRIDFNPSSMPKIELYNPDGTVKISMTDMFYTGIVGYYGYNVQTTLGGTFASAFDPVVFDSIVFFTAPYTVLPFQTGLYTARFAVVNGVYTAYSERYLLFHVLPRE